MALKRPPQHRGDAIPVYVDADDSAWDRERIKRECDQMRKDGADPARHPVNVYHSGDSRYDLGAIYAIPGGHACAADYLGQDATRFVLRRLSLPEIYRMTDLGATSALGSLYGCRLGVMTCEDPTGPKIRRDEFGVTDDSLQALYEWRMDLPVKLGRAAYLASKPLTDDEKKA